MNIASTSRHRGQDASASSSATRASSSPTAAHRSRWDGERFLLEARRQNGRQEGGPVAAEHPEALYFHIAADALADAETETEPFRLAQLICTCMVFSALTLEAFINQEYADPKVEKLDLGRMSLRSKWHNLPLLLGFSETFDHGAEPFATFGKLIQLRNRVLVHFTPGAPFKVGSSDPLHRIYADVVKDLAMAKGYFPCVEAMIRKLGQLTSGHTAIPAFLKGERYLSTISVSLSTPLDFGSPSEEEESGE